MNEVFFGDFGATEEVAVRPPKQKKETRLRFSKPTPVSELLGIVDGTFEEYRKMPGLNFHTLLDYSFDPAAYKAGILRKEDGKESDALRFGTQFHELLLQGEDVFEDHNALYEPPVNPKTGEPYGVGTKAVLEHKSEWGRAHQGKRIYTAAERDTLHVMAESVRKHPVAGPMMFGGSDKRSEFCMTGEVGGTLLKGSIDRYDDMFGIVDLKTVDRLSAFPSGKDLFQWAASDYHYVEQLAFYQYLVTEVGLGSFCGVSIVAVEKSSPNRTAVYSPSFEGLCAARETIKEQIALYEESLKADSWLSVYDGVFELKYYSKTKGTRV